MKLPMPIIPQIRHFWIPTLTDLQGHKMICQPVIGNLLTQRCTEFSAVAYFFAKKMYEKYHVPIGLINASVGGTPIEAWTSEEGLKEFPYISKTIEKNKDTLHQ